MREGAWRLLIGTLCVGAVCFYGGWRWRGRPDPDALRRADSLAVLVSGLEANHRQFATIDSARADSIRTLTSRLRYVRVRRETLIAHTDSLILRVPDTALADSLGGAIARERAASDSLTQVATLLVRLATDRAKAALLERDEYRTVALALQGQLAVAVRRPAPSRRLRLCAYVGAGLGREGLGPQLGVGVCY